MTRTITVTSVVLASALAVGTLCAGCVPESTDSDAPGVEPSALVERPERAVEATGVVPEPAGLAVTGITAVTVEDAPLEDPGAEAPLPVTRLMTILEPTAESDVNGTLAFVATEGGLEIEGEFEGLPPGRHAFHIHQFGDCSGEHGKTAGTHFNLKGSSENPPKDIQRITGDLGELVADDEGRAEVSARVPGARIDGPYSIVGRSVVVHAKGNDPSQPPIGAAGDRLACGVIGIARAPR